MIRHAKVEDCGFHIKINGKDYYGLIKNFTENHGWDNGDGGIDLSEWIDDSVKKMLHETPSPLLGTAIANAVEGESVSVAMGCHDFIPGKIYHGKITNFKMFPKALTAAAVAELNQKQGVTKLASKLNVFEYVVVVRVSDAEIKAGNKDSIIIGPKTILARDEKEVERIAIREVPEKVDIAMVEVVVRPFVG